MAYRERKKQDLQKEIADMKKGMQRRKRCIKRAG